MHFDSAYVRMIPNTFPQQLLRRFILLKYVILGATDHCLLSGNCAMRHTFRSRVTLAFFANFGIKPIMRIITGWRCAQAIEI